MKPQALSRKNIAGAASKRDTNRDTNAIGKYIPKQLRKSSSKFLPAPKQSAAHNPLKRKRGTGYGNFDAW